MSGLFKIHVDLTPEKPESPLFEGVESVADLHLRIMRLEALVVYVDQALCVLEPLVPSLADTRRQIALAMERPAGQRSN